MRGLVYLTCSHCKCEFLSSERQAKRAASIEGQGHRFYCSQICQIAGSSERRRVPPAHGGLCPTCGSEFKSRYEKLFCSMKCYVASDKFKAMLAQNSIKGSTARVLMLTGDVPQPMVEVRCLNCGATRIVTPSEAKTRRYCSARCYRAYMAARFDRWIASPEAIALPQGYDEFLCRNELPCLVDGCDWVGLSLGNHVNFAHGIPVEEFKRAAGFNLGTGLVTPAIAEKLSERPHIHQATFGDKRGEGATAEGAKVTRNYKSLEGREHHAKARALLHATVALSPRNCQLCGIEFEPQAGGWNTKYCSRKCRAAWYKRNRNLAEFWMTCALCGSDFKGTVSQRRRVDSGLKVFCGVGCRQKNNGRIAGEIRHQRCVQSAEFKTMDL